MSKKSKQDPAIAKLLKAIAAAEQSKNVSKEIGACIEVADKYLADDDPENAVVYYSRAIALGFAQLFQH